MIFLSEDVTYVKKMLKILQKRDGMLKKLSIEKDISTKKVLKKLSSAHSALAELKGIVATIPNENT